MTIDRLFLTDYRSHARLDLAAGPGFVALTGPNGAGKTNILEALSLLAPGRGLRGAPLPEMARHDGPGGFGVAATLAGAVEIGTGAVADRPDRRVVRVNGGPATAAALAERLSLLWLTPAMDRLFTEGAGGRRRFLDRLTLALHPGHAREATRYEAAMRARNSLLAEGGADIGWLTALEARMAEHGAAITAARADMVAALGHRLAAQAPDSAFPKPTIEIGTAGPDTAAGLVEAFGSGRPRDTAAGRTLTGPHRADLAVVHADKGVAAAQASTGEQKALLVGLLLAHAALVADRRGRPPVMLLDEVAAHLDPARRAQLFERLAATGAQVWMTGTEAALFEALPADATRIALGE